MNNFYNKYLKYKSKYLQLKGGELEYYHYTSDSNFTIDKLFDPKQLDEPTYKPNALWLSYNDEWEELVTSREDLSESFSLSNKYKIKFNEKDMYIIDSFEHMVEFHDRFVLDSEVSFTINWKKVQEHYPGIIVKNYRKILSGIRSFRFSPEAKEVQKRDFSEFMKHYASKYLWIEDFEIDCAAILCPTIVVTSILKNNF